MKKSILIPLILFIGAIAAYFYFSKEDTSSIDYLTAKPERTEFVKMVFASGELKAKKSTKIRAPSGMRSANIWQTSIKDLIPEGTFVEKGQYIGSLDRSEIATKTSDLTAQIETEMTKLEQTKIDTAISMKEIRDQLADIEFNIINEKLEMKRNAYEPNMVIEQSRINLEKSERSLRQLRSKQELIKIQSVSKVDEVDGMIKQLQTKINTLNELGAKFSIKAPEAGMLIYARTWNGNKKGAGTQVSSWDPVVAELPDLSTMISTAFVNEVDISKISKGQLVDVKVDAFPEKDFKGKIITVANIGQELKNQDAKVFEITIEIDDQDDVMKPAMTTSNEIKIYEYSEVVSVPLDAFYSDSLDYVLVKDGAKIYKQEVVSGPFNEDRIIIVSGLNTDVEILLSRSSESDIEFRSLDSAAKGQAMELIKKWEEEKAAYDKINKENVEAKGDALTQDTESGSGGMVIFG